MDFTLKSAFNGSFMNIIKNQTKPLNQRPPAQLAIVPPIYNTLVVTAFEVFRLIHWFRQPLKAEKSKRARAHIPRRPPVWAGLNAVCQLPTCLHAMPRAYKMYMCCCCCCSCCRLQAQLEISFIGYLFVSAALQLGPHSILLELS